MIDLFTIQDLLGTAMWAVPLVAGLTEVIKRTVSVDKKYMSAISVLIGIIIGLLISGPTASGAIIGVIIGLSATGLWEVGKTTKKAVQKK